MARPEGFVAARNGACSEAFERLLSAGGLPRRDGTPATILLTVPLYVLDIRDGGCVIPSCTTPSHRCQAHHLLDWQSGGRTDIDNLVNR